jgi:hypothetical protein
MDADHYRKELTRLAEAFNILPSWERNAALWDVISGYQDHHITKAITDLINNQRFYPSNAEIIAAVRSCQDQDWRTTKEKERAAAKDFFDPDKRRSPFDAAALATLKTVMNAKNKFEIIRAFNTMIKLYPGKGYEHELATLRRKWAAR